MFSQISSNTHTHITYINRKIILQTVLCWFLTGAYHFNHQMVETLLNTPFQKGNSIKQQTTGPEKPPNQTIWWLKGLPNKGFQRTSSWETEHPFHSPKSSLFTMTDSRPINSSHVSMMFGLVETTQHYWLQALMLRIRKKCAPNLWCDSWWPPTLSLYMLGHVDTRLDTRLDTCWSMGLDSQLVGRFSGSQKPCVRPDHPDSEKIDPKVTRLQKTKRRVP